MHRASLKGDYGREHVTLRPTLGPGPPGKPGAPAAPAGPCGEQQAGRVRIYRFISIGAILGIARPTALARDGTYSSTSWSSVAIGTTSTNRASRAGATSLARHTARSLDGGEEKKKKQSVFIHKVTKNEKGEDLVRARNTYNKSGSSSSSVCASLTLD